MTIAGLYMAFKPCILILQLFWLQTLVVIDSESYQKLFPSFGTLLTEVAVLFDLNQSRLPVLGQVVNIELLLAHYSIQNMDICSCAAKAVLLTQRPMYD